jgi:stringent starvation protein B
VSGHPVPRRPYLLRAMHEWISDCGQTPHVVVDVTAEGVVVPLQHAKDGRIVLNVSYRATEGLNISNERLSCSARFGGVNWNVEVPVNAVLGIYARETGEGMIFREEEGPTPAPPEGGGRPQLKVVK